MNQQSWTGRATVKPDSESGQALIEALVVVSGLAVLWIALHWLFTYADAALSATHASGYAAFAAARGEVSETYTRVVEPFMAGSAHRWKDRRGQSILDLEQDVDIAWFREPGLSEEAQPGGRQAPSSVLRREWAVEDEGVLHARVNLGFRGNRQSTISRQAGLLNLAEFDAPHPDLSRSTAILTDAAHAESDEGAQSRIADSMLAWSSAYQAAAITARQVTHRSFGVERAWNRAAPELDWLSSWRGRVPQEFLAHSF